MIKTLEQVKRIHKYNGMFWARDNCNDLILVYKGCGKIHGNFDIGYEYFENGVSLQNYLDGQFTCFPLTFKMWVNPPLLEEGEEVYTSNHDYTTRVIHGDNSGFAWDIVDTENGMLNALYALPTRLLEEKEVKEIEPIYAYLKKDKSDSVIVDKINESVEAINELNKRLK